jgi:hypothetical protein
MPGSPASHQDRLQFIWSLIKPTLDNSGNQAMWKEPAVRTRSCTVAGGGELPLGGCGRPLGGDMASTHRTCPHQRTSAPAAATIN